MDQLRSFSRPKIPSVGQMTSRFTPSVSRARDYAKRTGEDVGRRRKQAEQLLQSRAKAMKDGMNKQDIGKKVSSYVKTLLEKDPGDIASEFIGMYVDFVYYLFREMADFVMKYVDIRAITVDGANQIIKRLSDPQVSEQLRKELASAIVDFTSQVIEELDRQMGEQFTDKTFKQLEEIPKKSMKSLISGTYQGVSDGLSVIPPIAIFVELMALMYTMVGSAGPFLRGIIQLNSSILSLIAGFMSDGKTLMEFSNKLQNFGNTLFGSDDSIGATAPRLPNQDSNYSTAVGGRRRSSSRKSARKSRRRRRKPKSILKRSNKRGGRRKTRKHVRFHV